MKIITEGGTVLVYERTPGKIDDAWTILCRQICKDKDIDFETGGVEL